jgi:hypothetical protein
MRATFYRHHGGTNHAANAAWHMAVDAEELLLVNGKLDRMRGTGGTPGTPGTHA